MFSSSNNSTTTNSATLSIAPVTSISIQNNKFIRIDLFNQLFDMLINCKTLKSVKISNNIIPSGFDKVCALFTKLFKSNKNIRNINLSNNFIYTKYFVRILKEGLAGSLLYILDISCNFITYEGWEKLAEWLKYHRTLRVLNLHHNSTNDLKKEGSEMILEELKHPINFLSLDLSNMVLTGFGQKMGNFINSCLTLRDLKIEKVKMNSKDVEEITKAVSDSNSLEFLNISQNSFDDASLEHLSKMIEKNKSIKIIYLEKLKITTKNFEKFLKVAFERNTTLEELSFNGNSELKFGDLYEVFFKKKKIKKLCFKSIPVKEEEQMIFVKLFRELRKDVTIEVDDF